MESVAEATFDDLVEVELARLHADSASLLEGVRRRGLWPSSSQHIGFALPLVVGGSCEIENVEIVDAEVHLAILAEIVAKTAAVANGAKITRFVD
ncbi:MAG: T6SS immunity protein Tdi1 domain-containing protein [Myxococcota bacterium]